MTTVKKLIENLQFYTEKGWLKDDDIIILLDNEQSSLFLDITLPKVILSDEAIQSLIPKKAIGIGFITNPFNNVDIEFSDRENDTAVYNGLKSWADIINNSEN